MPHALHEFVLQVLSTAQAGLTYSRDPFDIGRFRALQDAAAGLLARHDTRDADVLRELVSADTGYPTPKLDVRAFILDAQGHVLLTRERTDGLWTLPGGWCDAGQSPGEAAAREVGEETGLRVRTVRLLALWDKYKHAHPPQLPHACKAFFLCEVEGGTLLQETDETCGCDWYPPDTLPPLSRNRVLEAQIRTLAAHVRSGRVDALFD